MKPYNVVLAGTGERYDATNPTRSLWREELQAEVARLWAAYPHRRVEYHSPEAWNSHRHEPVIRLDVLSPAPDVVGESLFTRLAQYYEAQHDPEVSYRVQLLLVLTHDHIWHHAHELAQGLVTLVHSGRALIIEQPAQLAQALLGLLEQIPERFEHTSIERFGQQLQLGPVLETRADGVMFEHQGHRLFVNDVLNVGTVATALLEQTTHLHDLRTQLKQLGEAHIRSYARH